MRRFVRLKNDWGKNALVSEDGQTASRREPEGTYSRATVFIDKPFPPDRCFFQVIVLATQKRWAGNCKLRLVTDPGEVTQVSVREDATSNREDLIPGSIIGLSRDPRGRCWYHVKPAGKPEDPLREVEHLKDLPTGVPLFGVADLYGKSTSIKLCEPLDWSPETHKHFPEEFRFLVKTLLLCHRRQDPPNLVSSLPKFVLLDIFVILGVLYDAYRPLSTTMT